jgi:hypothetical protein
MIKMNSKLTFLGMLCLLTLTALPQQWNGLTYYSNMGTTSGYLMDTSSVNVKTYTFTGGTSYRREFFQIRSGTRQPIDRRRYERQNAKTGL